MRFSNVPYPERIERGTGGVQGTKLDLTLVFFGALLASAGVELFLAPHQLIVGGLTGVSMVVAYELELRTGIILLLLNIPLCYWLLRRAEHTLPQPWLAFIGSLVFGLAMVVLHPFPGLTDDRLPAAVVGGAALGIGMGLVIRNGGLLDAALRPYFQGRRGESSWMLPILANVSVILLTWSWYEHDQVLHSALAVGVMLLAMHQMVTRSSVERVLCVETKHPVEVRKAIAERTRREARDYQIRTPEGAAEHGEQGLALTISRLEIESMKAIVKKADPGALIYVEGERRWG